MDTLQAAMRAAAAPPNSDKVFDWHKAAQIIKDRQPFRAEAGLEGDHEWTGGTIYRDGKPVFNDYTYLASSWCPAELVIDDEYIECWLPAAEQPGWGAHTKWPESALAILNGDVIDVEATAVHDQPALPEAGS